MFIISRDNELRVAHKETLANRVLVATENTVQAPQEFHLPGQHDQESHGGGKGGGSSAGEEDSSRRRAALKKIVIGATVAGVAVVGYKKAPATVRFSEAGKRSANLERLLKKGGPDLDKAIIDRTDKIARGVGVERNARELSVLKNKEFLHQDDAASFLKGLEKNKYSKAEVDGLWEYGGMFRDPEKAGDLTKGPFRFQRQLRAGTRLNRKDQNTMDLLDSAIKKNTLPRDVKLFRGMAATDKEFTKWSKMKPGYVFQDEAPMFTGLTESRARPHYIDDVLPTSGKFNPERVKSVLFQINAPKGLPAVSSPFGLGLKNGKRLPVPPKIRGHSVPGHKRLNYKIPYMEHFNKEELVLRRKQKLRLVSSTMRDDGVLILNVEAII